MPSRDILDFSNEFVSNLSSRLGLVRGLDLYRRIGRPLTRQKSDSPCECLVITSPRSVGGLLTRSFAEVCQWLRFILLPTGSSDDRLPRSEDRAIGGSKSVKHGQASYTIAYSRTLRRWKAAALSCLGSGRPDFCYGSSRIVATSPVELGGLPSAGLNDYRNGLHAIQLSPLP